MDYLQELCDKLNIELKYTNNKLTVLSSGIQNNKAVLRAHSIFKSCPEKVAKFIVGYYCNFEDDNTAYAGIEEYIKTKISNNSFKVSSPNVAFIKQVNKNWTPAAPLSNTVQNENDPYSLVEMEILSITKSDFFGNKTEMKPDEVLTPTSENVLELNIIVSSNRKNQ